MEIAVLEEPQKKIFRARKTMKLSDRQQLEVLHHTLATTASGSPSSSSRPQTPLMNGTHAEKDSQRKETGSKSPVSPSSSSSPLPPISLSLSRSPSPTVAPSENPSPAPSEKKKASEEGKGEKEKKVEKKTEEGKADKTETSKPIRAGSPSSSDKKSNPRNASSASPSASAQALNGEMSSMDVDSTCLDNGLAEESGKGSSSSSSSPSGSPSAGLECDPEVKEGFLCLSEEEEGQGERDEVKEGSEEKMDTDKEEKKEAEKGGKEADSTGNSTPASKKRSLSPLGGKDVESKGPGDSKRAKVDGVELEAQLELKITAKASSRLKLEKVVQQLVEERIRVLQQTVFDRSLQELKERVEKMDATIKEQKALQHISMLNAKVARLSKKFGNANQALENSKKETAATPVKVIATTGAIPATQCTTRAAVDPKLPILSPGSTSSTASPAQPKPLSTPITASSSALASTAPILQIISTTTSSTPVSSTASMSGQSQQGTLVLQTRPNPGVMTTSSASPSGQPVSIQPLLIQLPLPAGGVGLIPVSSLATVNNVNKAKTTTATTTFILQKAAGNVVSSSVPLSSSTTPQTSLARPAYQGGTATASSPSAAVSVTTARTPTQCAAVVGVATASSSPVATGPAATGSSAASTAPPSASKTDNQASNSTQSKTPAQPSRPKGSVIDLTEDDDDVQVTGVQKAPATPTATSTQRPLGAPPPLVTSTSTVRTSGQQRPSVDSPSKSRPASSSLAPLPPLPLAPSPPARLPPEAALTSPPQQPQLKLARVQSQNGIVLSWCVAETDRSCAPVDSYHLYAYHQDHQGAGGGASTPSLWKKIGEVKALPLPMACTLTQFVSGSTYYFAVRAKDVYGRFGAFCEPQCTDVINSTSSGTS